MSVKATGSFQMRKPGSESIKHKEMFGLSMGLSRMDEVTNIRPNQPLELSHCGSISKCTLVLSESFQGCSKVVKISSSGIL